MAVSYKPQLNYTDFKDLTEQIHFHSSEGKIWFGEQRMLLMNLTSLAAFRREIVNSMGIERAKGFFLRLGTCPASKMQSLPASYVLTAASWTFFLQGPLPPSKEW